MTIQTLNRFEWLKAVTQADSKAVNDNAARLATALAIQFANDETGQINPSLRTLAIYLSRSEDSVKRAVRSLEVAGWITRTEGRGNGNKTSYTLVSPGAVVAITRVQTAKNRHSDKGGKAAPLANQKGANLRGKGGKTAPSYNKDKQSLEQRGGNLAQWKGHRFEGNAYDGLILVRGAEHGKLSEWGRWLKANGYQALRSFPIVGTGTDGRTEFFRLPMSEPPESERGIREAHEFFGSLQAEDTRMVVGQ